MKKIIMACAVFLSVSTGAQELSNGPKDLREYAAAQKPLVDSGQLLASTFYSGLYSRLLNSGAPADSLERMSRMIRYAEMYESGSIDKSEYDYKRRLIQAEQVSAEQSAQVAAQARDIADRQAAEAGQRQRSNAVLATAAQLLQSSGPRTLGPAPGVAMSPPGVIAGFLQSQSENGFLRYCRYSNGVVNTVSVTTLCPMSAQ